MAGQFIQVKKNRKDQKFNINMIPEKIGTTGNIKHE